MAMGVGKPDRKKKEKKENPEILSFAINSDKSTHEPSRPSSQTLYHFLWHEAA